MLGFGSDDVIAATQEPLDADVQRVRTIQREDNALLLGNVEELGKLICGVKAIAHLISSGCASYPLRRVILDIGVCICQVADVSRLFGKLKMALRLLLVMGRNARKA